ncbi:Histone-lysine N-methyltransferase MLL [Gossypium australe]|uniref:Histone-lysine N-methyltransferase MLL n=1 Tax=Gossypium australe TaxID=47621 RepID=A0A5B6VR15_9ROSI|nr:Histone-lysine N-methyltransferase MLL [Gossypium australe]
MAFHVACPITCRRICFCSLGFPRNLHSPDSKHDFLQELIRVEAFLKDPLGVTVSRERTVQVRVPKVTPVPAGDGGDGVDAVEDSASVLAAQSKRLVLQRKAAAEVYARKVEPGDIAVASIDSAPQEQGQSNKNVTCHMCFAGENEGSERARRMLACRNCGKKYHRSCLKSWVQHRVPGLAPIVEPVRCAEVLEIQLSSCFAKGVMEHTIAIVNIHHTRWFLEYTCCDACGSIHVKANRLLKFSRNMNLLDILQLYRFIETQNRRPWSAVMFASAGCTASVTASGSLLCTLRNSNLISALDEKYLQFQVDANLQYKCAACRGECYQVTDLEDAVQELWKRRDRTDQDLIASLRAAAGLPTQEEIFSISPYSDDEENGPVMFKKEFVRSPKFSLKGIADKPLKKNKEYGKESSSKKYLKKKTCQASLISKGESKLGFEGNQDIQSQGYSVSEYRIDEVAIQRDEGQNISSPGTETCSTNQPGILKNKLVDEVMVSDEDRKSRVLKIKSSKPHDLDSGDDKQDSKSNTLKAKKLVINLGSRKINVTNSPKPDASNCQRERDVISYNGVQDAHQQSHKFMLDTHDNTAKSGDGYKVYQSKSRRVKTAGKAGNVIKFGKIKPESPELGSKVGAASSSDGYEIGPLEQPRVASGKGSIDVTRLDAAPSGEASILRGGKVMLRKWLEDRADTNGESNEDFGHTPVLKSFPKDSKLSLKFKLKKPDLENQNSKVHSVEEKSSIKGQRSKRQRPSTFVEKSLFNVDEDLDVTHTHQNSIMDGMMDANWILKKLGKDAIGKKVEIHHASDNSWHKGAVHDIIEGTSTVSVMLDDGRVKSLELGKQGIRFVLQKQKRSKF